MKSNFIAAFVLVCGFFLTAASLNPLSSIQPSKSTVTFKINNLGVTVDGSFSNPSGSIVFDPNDLANSSVNASIKVSTINTGIEMRDEDLKTDEYFDVGKYPEMRFRSTSITKDGAGYKANGQLTIKKTTKTVNIPFTVENNTFKGNFTIDRLDYHVGESSWIMGDDVRVSFSLAIQ